MHRIFKLIQLCCADHGQADEDSSSQPKHINQSLDITSNPAEKLDLPVIEKNEMSGDETALAPVAPELMNVKKKKHKKISKKDNVKKSSHSNGGATPISRPPEESKVPLPPAEKKPLKGILKKPKI
ncbi:unnamed protein product [Blepharisma stoltei]|uniref:Uncharacterized protein n=1 Tax=Blepharisma stoltei TaxID=1481888 RepID=A0AAU9K5U2_9CILI|nr:unnamed protein product [Blepharisma stoltei]